MLLKDWFLKKLLKKKKKKKQKPGAFFSANYRVNNNYFTLIENNFKIKFKVIVHYGLWEKKHPVVYP